VCKAVSGLANEGRALAFMPVAQDAGRKVALSIFSHILSLDIEFHMARRTVREGEPLLRTLDARDRPPRPRHHSAAGFTAQLLLSLSLRLSPAAAWISIGVRRCQ
jgi:hypothetical protein